jgi:molybdopterin biosynthesis enzyme
LPGNPVSVMVTGRRFAAAALRKRAGFDRPDLPPAQAAVREPDDRTLSLYWYRLVRCVEPGVVELVPNRGSGDLVAAARSDGFVEIPPRRHGAGPWPYYPWMP